MLKKSQSLFSNQASLRILSYPKRLLFQEHHYLAIKEPKSPRTLHPIYQQKNILKIEQTHYKTTIFKDKLALNSIRFMRGCFDWFTGYNEQKMTDVQWINRCIFLESVAGVPGMVGGMAKHLKSLRSLKQDHGMIHHLLEEAENERVHLFIFLNLKKPGRLFQTAVVLTQGIFFNMFFIAYMLSPSFCHRLVGFLEEEAVHTYTVLLKHIEVGGMQEWQTQIAPKMARDYYELPENATMKDLVLSVRADESIHRDVNHRFASLKQDDDADQEIVKFLENDYRIWRAPEEPKSQPATK